MSTGPKNGVLAALVEAGVLDSSGARRAGQVAAATGESPVSVVHQLALAEDDAVANALSAAFGLPRLAQQDGVLGPIHLTGLSLDFLQRRKVMPLATFEDVVWVGVVDPFEAEGPDAIAFASSLPVERFILAFSEWRSLFDAFELENQADDDLAIPEVSGVNAWTDDTARVRDQSDSAPAVRLVDSLLDRALEQGASDIHVEPLPDRVRIRFRIDGELRTVAEEPAHLAAPIAARIKILADMDVADRRRPQDGRTSLAARGKPVDVRISTVPSSYGETVALRLLRRDASLLDLKTLGFSGPLLTLFEHILSLRRGLFLVTGPTGSGKTTTLYAMLQRLRGAPLKILSIEDPIEYFFPDITQTQVNEDAGLTFASALRSFLRQDPDVILVGEIRDGETARIAIQAALTGHLVLATLHTNDAAGAVSRLVDMGVDRYLVGATLTAVVAQRLARRLCPVCRMPRPVLPDERAVLREGGVESSLVFDAPGCNQCHNTGYAGRIAIGEGFAVNDAVRWAITDASGAGLNAGVRAAGLRPLFDEAARLVAIGEVSVAELRSLAIS